MSRLTRRGKILQRVKVSLVILALLLAVVVAVHQYTRISPLNRLLTTQDWVLDLFLTEASDSYESTSDLQNADPWRETFVPDSVIFSAYLDTRPEVILRVNQTGQDARWALIRIIGIMPVSIEKEAIDCIYKYRENGVLSLRRKPVASITAIKLDNLINHRMKYNVYFILCNVDVSESMKYSDVRSTGGLMPVSVSVGLNDGASFSMESTYFVDVQHDKSSNLLHRKDRWIEDSLAVCIPVSLSYYDQPVHLIEFLEYYKLLGVEHFTFYNSSISPRVSDVLRYYMDFGDVTVVPSYPSQLHVKISELGSHAALAILNDCLYRSSFYDNYKYVAVVNTNEFIVPKVHYGLDELMTYLESDRQKKYAEFLFSTALFFTDLQNDGFAKFADMPFLYTQAKTRRTPVQYTVKLSERYIARSSDVVQLGTSGVQEFLHSSSLTKSKKSYVGRNIALLHRYELCKPDYPKKGTIIDRTAHKYVKELAYRVRRVCKSVFGSDHCPAEDDQSDFHSKAKRTFSQTGS